MTSPKPNMAPPPATEPEDSQPIFCPSAQVPAPATTKESQQAYDADQGMPPTRITGSPLHVPRTGPLRSGPCPFTARCPASTQPVTGLPDSDQERGGCGACGERSSLVYGLPKEPQSKGQQQPPARERAGMPPQASAAGHRVAARVRWVAMITTMHPASVAHPHASGVPLLLLAHRGTPFTWREACHPDQQATRPFAAPYAARAGALGSFRLHTGARRTASGAAWS